MTLAACLFALAFFDVPTLRWAGVSGAFAVLFAMVTNLTLVPAALLAFPRFFAAESCGGCCNAPAVAPPPPSAAAPDPPPRPASAFVALARRIDAMEAAGTRHWYAAADVCVRYKFSVSIILSLVLVVPFAPQLALFSPTADYSSTLPRGSASLALWNTLPGRIPYNVTAQTSTVVGVYRGARAPPSNSTLSPVFAPGPWAAIQAKAAVLLASRPDTKALTAVAFTTLSGGNISLSATVDALTNPMYAACPPGGVAACAAGPQPACSLAVCVLRSGAAASLAPNGLAISMALQPPHDTYTTAGYAWQKSIASALQQGPDDGQFDWFFPGDGGYVSNVTVDYVYGLLPAVLGGALMRRLRCLHERHRYAFCAHLFPAPELALLCAALAAVLAFILGVAFRSVAVPIRAVFTIALTLSA